MWQGVAMRAIPLPVRERIIRLYEQGKSTTEIAEFSGFCVAAVRRVRQHFKARGTLEPQTHFCGRKTLLTAQRKARLQKLVADQPDATLAELGTGLDRPFGTSTVDLWLRRLGLSYKKNAARRRAAPSRRGQTKEALARRSGGGARHPARVRG
jgi:transposase